MTQLRNADLTTWLVPARSEARHYRHARIDEDATGSEAGLVALSEAVALAHADARRWFEELLADSLDPFDQTDVPSGYPAQLHTLTLQGYLGEIFAAIIAENFDPHGFDWEVPAFLFRFHNAAIEGLDRRLQLGDGATRTPGRTGDDCVAFRRDEQGRIEAWLNCEAKCSATHTPSLISGGHQQLSRPLRRAASALQLIEVLKDSTEADAADWVAALRIYRQEAMTPDAPVRADMFVYVCGTRPQRQATWLPTDKPHWGYSATHPIEAVEVHLENVHSVLQTVYPGHRVARD